MYNDRQSGLDVLNRLGVHGHLRPEQVPALTDEQVAEVIPSRFSDDDLLPPSQSAGRPSGRWE